MQKLRNIILFANAVFYVFTDVFGAKLQNTPNLICILLNNNSIYCYIPRSSKHTDTCNGWVGVFCNRSSHRYREGHGFESRWSPGMSSINWLRFIAQLVEHRNGIWQRSRVWIPSKSWYFQAYSFQFRQLENTAMITLHLHPLKAIPNNVLVL